MARKLLLAEHEALPGTRSLRQPWGWFAWLAVVGYIQEAHSPDVTLVVEMYPREGVVLWASELAFGSDRVEVRDKFGFGPALNDLWEVVAATYAAFAAPQLPVQPPTGYEDDQWADAATLDSLTRLVGVTSTVFKEDWRLIVYYRPVPVPDDRTQARLIAKRGTVSRAGRGATLRDACRNLFHNAAPDYRRNTERLTLT
jgi:hypothetical protein